MTNSTYCNQMIAVIALIIPLICNASDTLPSSESAGAKAGLQITQSGGSFEHRRDTRRRNRSQLGKGNAVLARGDIAEVISPTPTTHNRCPEGKSLTIRGCRSQLGKNTTTASHGDFEKTIAPSFTINNRCSEGKILTIRGCRGQLEKSHSLASRQRTD